MKTVENRKLVDGQKVFVYFNIHKKMFSIQSMEGETKGLVVAHSNQVSLKNGCEFRVREKGRERVLQEQRKNVHAGVIGEIDLKGSVKKGATEVKYDPYKYSSFVYALSKEEVHNANEVFLENKKVFV